MPVTNGIMETVGNGSDPIGPKSPWTPIDQEDRFGYLTQNQRSILARSERETAASLAASLAGFADDRQAPCAGRQLLKELDPAIRVKLKA